MNDEVFNAGHMRDLIDLRETVAAQALIIQEMGDHLALLRTIALRMLMQASLDETDQTEAGNPWLKLRKDFVAVMNPRIRTLNAMLGITVADQKPDPIIAVVTK